MNAEQEGRAAAKKFRARHALGTQPIPDLVAVIELLQGIDVAILDADPDQHGMAVRDPDRGLTVIGAARTPHPMRQRSTLAHELCHVLFDDFKPEVLDGRTREEARADTFARHLLIPDDALRSTFTRGQQLGLQDLSTVVQRYMVSPSMAALQFGNIELIDSGTRDEWRAQTAQRLATRFGWSDQYAAMSAQSERRRAPQQLLARAIDGYRSGVVSLSAVARLRGLPPDRVEEELRAADIAPTATGVRWSAPERPDFDIDLSDLDAT